MSTATQLAIATMVLHECDIYRLHCIKHGYFQVTVARDHPIDRSCPTCRRDVGICAFAVGATNRDLPYVSGPIDEAGKLSPRVHRHGMKHAPNPDMVKEMLKLRDEGWTQAAIARKFKYSQRGVCRIFMALREKQESQGDN